MKNPQGSFSDLKVILTIGLLAVFGLTTTACQKAKMRTVPRQEAPKPGPGGGEPAPDVTPDDINPEPQPPVVISPGDSGEGGDEEQPPVVITPEDPDDRVIINPPPRPRVPDFHVTPQPGIPSQGDNILIWLDPNAPVRPSVLNHCAWERCEDPPPPPPAPIRQEAQSYTQTSEPITNLLDVVFVVDTSNSLDDERAAVARNMHRFANEVARLSERAGAHKDLDLQMGVILAHGPGTDKQTKLGQSAHGHLFVHQKETLSPLPILKSSELSIDTIKEKLLERFNGKGDITSVRDRSNAQGEAGLLSLDAFLQQEISKSSGFPRSDAALMVIFISDENDVCYDYKRFNDFYASQGINRVDTPQSHSKDTVNLNGIRRDKPEHEAFISACGSGDRGQPEAVEQALKQLKNFSPEIHNNLPLMTAGVLYTSKSDAETAQRDGKKNNISFWGDNEMGHGYMHLIYNMGGQVTSLLDADFGQQLANYGKSALFQMNFYSSLPIKNLNGDWIDLRIIPNSSIEVTVDVKVGHYAGQTITLIQDREYIVDRANANPGEPVYGRILLNEDSREGLVWDNAVIRIFYTTAAE